MYGTIVRFRPKTGQEGTVDAMIRDWLRERASVVAGFVAEYALTSETHPGERLALAIFDSKANYLKNADDPEQDRWHRQFRAALEADPEWNDGEIVALEPESTPL